MIIKQEFDVNCRDHADQLEQQPEHLLYLRLQIIFRSLPRDMFINRILKTVSSSEPDLESHRAMLFDLIKECEDFPYGLQAELKRRVHTRNGDTVATKLAQDIYCLMSVLEGSDYSELKDLIAGGKKGQRAQSQSVVGNMTLTSCDCASEVKSLESSLNNMKADVLGLKQQYVASEATRSSQIQTLKSTVLGLKADLSTLTSTVTKAVTDIVLAAQRIESEKSLGVYNLRTEVRLLKDSVRDIHDTLENMTYGPSAGLSTASKPRKQSKKGKKVEQKRCLSDNDIITTQNINSDSYTCRQPAGESADVSEDNKLQSDSIKQSENEQTHGVSTETGSHGDNNVVDQTRCNTTDWTVTSGERLIAVPAPPSDQVNVCSSAEVLEHGAYGVHGSYHDTVDTGGVGSSGGVDSTDPRSESPVNIGDSDRASLWPGSGVGRGPNTSRYQEHSLQCIETQPFSYSKAISSVNSKGQAHVGASDLSSALGSSIPVHTTNNVQSEIDAFIRADVTHGECDIDADFAQYVRKKPKRYYLGGFLPSITEAKIAQYVNKRGPTVTFIRIWHSRRKANNVVIRLNVEDNEFADRVVSSTFWPRGVTCRPWLDRNERNRERNTYFRDPGRYTNDVRSRYRYGRSDIDDYNPYSPLRDRANID
ncbi:MAG: hypothetical protein N0C90_25530 [Candidatus Thiodiazotropha endolucinida]|nr:hypothetical protein [Candidatus Thiodiazotropha taylori]MCW4264710.1 hypothetical protein [Candidatus Thiodiazotropha endolucinida]